ncbi:MAG: hypothetical protein JXR46_03765 [Calditrichaceae bacterium]|nr:hypothetical protein [Calditrichaceae bacterium]MBN2708142.1 hypothetical protein [Calditrichaceae bacterium]
MTDGFIKDLYFNLIDIENEQDPSLNDLQWQLLNLPHKWGIEEYARFEMDQENLPEFPIVKGKWKFSEGNNLLWKNPDLNDNFWQIVKLPSTCDDHFNYTADNVYGWYRHELSIPSSLKG